MLQRPEADLLHIKLWKRLVEPCPKCRGSGSIAAPTDDPFDTRYSDCSCKREVKRRCALMDANIPKEYWGVLTWSMEHNLELFEGHIVPYCADLAAAAKEGRGVLMYGENGVGKTTFAAYILARAQAEGYRVGYLLAHQLLAYTIEARSNTALGDWLRDLVGADFLVLDEMGKEHKKSDSEFAAAELDTLLRMRRGNLKPTIMATNLNRVQFNEGYGESIESILKGSLQLHFEAGDHRATMARRDGGK